LFPTFKLVSLTVSCVVSVIFLFSRISLFAVVYMFIIVMCALDMLLIKATYLLTYLHE